MTPEREPLHEVRSDRRARLVDVIDSSREDVASRLTELHGQGANALGQPRPGTDVYIVTFGDQH
ncbi:hypothetical protein GCM10022419_116980 [Nonomuraea rosea]|uniref:Uncharacterized protein n=1 Tax=Nonomuraea rosea TaxID=638574 RepID=A0ABP6ZKA0_9ACTN